MATLTLPITMGFERSKILGSVTIEEEALISADLVLALGGQVLERGPNLEVTLFKAREFGLIHPSQHTAVMAELQDLRDQIKDLEQNIAALARERDEHKAKAAEAAAAAKKARDAQETVEDVRAIMRVHRLDPGFANVPDLIAEAIQGNTRRR